MKRAGRSVVPMLLAGLLAVIAGCNTGTEGGTFEPDLGSMVIKVDSTDYTIVKGPLGSGGQHAESKNASISISATFIRAAGGQELNITSSDFELRAAASVSGDPFPSSIHFNRTSAFAGTLDGLATGQEIQVYFSLYHKSQVHTDFGPYFLFIKRAADSTGPPPI